MKGKTLKIIFKNYNVFKSEVTNSLKKMKKNIQKKNEIVFDSVVSFRKFMTSQKVEILSAIVNNKPSSIYELANLVDRDFAAVFKDCNALELVGFINLEDKKDSKKTKTPKLAFNYSIIMVEIPNSPYNIAFDEAA